MCDPVTITLTTLAVASTASQIVGEAKAAKRQNAAIGEAFQAQQKEIARTQTADTNERAREGQKERARVRASAAQAGLKLSGSVQAQIQDSLMQESLFNERTSMNADTRREASRQEANSMYSRVESPSVLGAGLRLASAGTNAYYTGQGLRIQRDAAARGPQ